MRTALRATALLAAACVAGCFTARARLDRDDTVRIAGDDGGPELTLRLSGFRITSPGPIADAEDPVSGILLTATVQEAAAADCRAFYWSLVQQTPNLRPQDVRMRERGQWRVVEYLIPYGLVPGTEHVRIDQRNWLACDARAGTFAYIHLSKIQYQPADDAAFEAVLERATFTERDVGANRTD